MALVLPGVRRFAVADVPQEPWRNGGGFTRTLAVGKSAGAVTGMGTGAGAGADAGSWRWRVSLATIARDGAFSCFPGVDRLSLLVGGTALDLTEADGRHRLHMGLYQSARYDGNTERVARVTGAPLQCLNVMTRRGLCQSCLKVVSQPTKAQGECVLLVLKGHFNVADGTGRETGTLLPEHGLCARAQAPLHIVPQTPNSLLALVEFTAV